MNDQKGSKAAVLQALRIYGSLSRIELARMLKLSRAAISTSISELMECNLIEETTEKRSSGGRPATPLTLVPEKNFILGADFDNRVWTLGAFDLAGNIQKVVKIPANDTSLDTVISALISQLDLFIESLGKRPVKILGLGMPGLVDSNDGLIISAADIGWYNVDFRKLIHEKTGLPVVIINRHRARGIAECRFGSAKEFKQVIYVGIGSGIAAGFFQDRMLITGSMGGAGELGHVTIVPDGPICPCGNHGCLQMLSSGPAMEQAARILLRQGEPSVLVQNPGYDLQLIKAEDICAAAEAGDRLAMKVVSNAGIYVGIALANIVNLLNPEAIILGGPIPRNSAYYVKIATETIKQRAMSPLASGVAIRTAFFKEIGGAIGAANYALDKHISLIL